MKITWGTDCNAPCCSGQIVADDGRKVLIQTDWDYPGTASTFGWSLRNVQTIQREDFDYQAECGVFACHDCHKVFYPMELESGQCPICDGKVEQYHPCEHDSTDGTVKCRQCGIDAGTFISHAGDWLSDNDGAMADDPGYFE